MKLPDRKLIILSKSNTNFDYGKRPEDRDIKEHLNYGVINLDKPAGPTSHEVTAWVKKILKVKKAGHGGTLDPKVSGVLPITLVESTKLVKILLNADKEYVCIMRIHNDFSQNEISDVLSKFTSNIYQKPPVKSAVKRRLRTREIYAINLLEINNRDILFNVRCEAGTYIRKLCHDIGEVIGYGAHMVELRRIKSGIFDESTVSTLHDLIDAYAFYIEDGREDFLRKSIISVEVAVGHLPKIVVRDGAVDALCHGADLAIPGIVKLDSGLEIGMEVAIMTLKGELIAIGNSLMDVERILIEEKGIAVRTKRVIMKRSTYPRHWSKQN